MCGIAGFYNLKGDPRSNIGRILSEISHRGPDAQGVWIDPQNTGVVLGHKRLSIIDLTETGSQPMLSHSGRYVIAYNGEIYNYRVVLDEMRSAGYTDAMNGTSDTEVLVEAIEFFGIEEAISRCKGMFGIALYDREEHTLTLIRDRIGEKPLYYGVVDGAFVFGSELGCFVPAGLENKGFDEKLNYDCISDYLKYGYISAPNTIYRDIYKLEAGNALKIKFKFDKQPQKTVGDYVVSNTKYWNITDVARSGIERNQFSGTREEAASKLENLLKNSIEDQMVADVPLGAFLSAGIDSATVVSLMQNISSIPVRTFTIGFEDKEYNEADAASEIARHLGTEHTELYVTKQDALDVIPKLPRMFGEPFADSSQIPTYLVSKMTRQHVTVSLSGDGGDELFAGYRDYIGVNNIYSKIRNIPLPVRKVMSAGMQGMGVASYNLRAHGVLMGAKNPVDLYRRTYETNSLYRDLLGVATLEGRNSKTVGHTCIYDDFDPTICGEDTIHTAMLMNMRMYHPDDILCKVDRTAMAVSLETRVPMLDRDVVEFAWTLPMKYLNDGNKGKLILRDILYKYVPKELMDRPKKGFGVPISQWLREDGLCEWANELLNQESINRYKVLDNKQTYKMWSDYINKGIWRPQIWYALMLQSWLQEMR